LVGPHFRENIVDNIVPSNESDAEVLQFLERECPDLVSRSKFNLKIVNVVEAQWTTDGDGNIICQGEIDRGANADVYRVLPTAFRGSSFL